MNWMKTAWTFLRRLPVAKWIKPLWKKGLQEAAQAAGDALQNEIGSLIVEQGDKALPAVQAKIDGFQSRISKAIDGLPFPSALEAKVKDAINGPVDALQSQLSAGCSHGNTVKAQIVFNAAFDKFQSELATRIAAL